MNKKLLPCPFCGSEAFIMEFDGWETGCRTCGAYGPFRTPDGFEHQDEETARALWNNRKNFEE